MFELLKQFGVWAAIDILIIAAIIYNLLILLRGTRAMQMVFGLIVIFGSVFIFTQFYPLNTLKWLMNKFYPSLIIVLVIIFQDDIRRVLSGVGKKSFFSASDPISSKLLLDEITRAAFALAQKKIGALITIERNIILTRYVEVGVLLDARVSKEIMLCIFHPSSPVHDGSIIIQQGRISAAGCFLPLTRDAEVDPNLGTRHRAAIGITQETDAVVVLVSEELGAVALVADGNVSRGLTPKELRKALRSLVGTRVANDTVMPVRLVETSLNRLSILKKMRIFRPKSPREDA